MRLFLNLRTNFMKKEVLIFILLVGIQAISQIYDPVKWTATVEKISDTEYDLIATAVIEGDWHLYSQNVPDNGPIPTIFIFKGSSYYLKKGNTKEGKGHEINDPVFEMVIKYFEKKAIFKQRIKIKSVRAFEVNGLVEFMVCNDSQCLPPKEVDLIFKIPA